MSQTPMKPVKVIEPQQNRVRRAFISVFDKTDIVEFAQNLNKLGIEIVSSGGTAKAISDEGIPVTTVEDITGFPAMLDHRVATLHPNVHGGLLADLANQGHVDELNKYNIEPFQLIVNNLYPFTSKPGIENIDIGGPALIRAGAKNYEWVGVVTSPTQYDAVLSELNENDSVLSDDFRWELAIEAFAVTATFDAEVLNWLQLKREIPQHLVVPLELSRELRYGENPHQQAGWYVSALRNNKGTQRDWLEDSTQHQGKELSYINVLDMDAAQDLVENFGDPACVIVKHANPCGVAVSEDVSKSYLLAFECDSTSAFGGVVAFNCHVNEEAAKLIAEKFTEVVLAPSFSDEALEVLAKSKNLRVISSPNRYKTKWGIKSVGDGYLIQENDNLDEGIDLERKNWEVVSDAQPDEDMLEQLKFAWKVCAHTSSNAIVITNNFQAVGVGAGQQSRVHASKIASEKAAHRAVNGVCASDAFFPFRDGIDFVVDAGVKAIIQPGGSIRDDEVIEAANEHGIVMIFTGARHFRH